MFFIGRRLYSTLLLSSLSSSWCASRLIITAPILYSVRTMTKKAPCFQARKTTPPLALSLPQPLPFVLPLPLLLPLPLPLPLPLSLPLPIPLPLPISLHPLRPPLLLTKAAARVRLMRGWCARACACVWPGDGTQEA